MLAGPSVFLVPLKPYRAEAKLASLHGARGANLEAAATVQAVTGVNDAWPLVGDAVLRANVVAFAACNAFLGVDEVAVGGCALPAEREGLTEDGPLREVEDLARPLVNLEHLQRLA